MTDQTTPELTDEERIRRRDGLPTPEAREVARQALAECRRLLRGEAK